MAIAFVSKGGNFTNTGTITTLTWAVTVSGTDTMMFTTGRASNTGDNMTAAYNGDSMTKITGQSGSADRVFLFALVNPDAGTNNMVITKPSFAAGQMDGSSACYSGVKQSLPLDASGTGTATSTSGSVSVTVVASNCWLVGGIRGNAGGASSDGSGTTSRSGGPVGDTSSQICISDSNGTVGTGAQTLNWTMPNDVWYAVGASVEAAPSTGPANVKSLNGLAIASVKSVNGLAIASVKSKNGLA
jgi:hypothetical protein